MPVLKATVLQVLDNVGIAKRSDEGNCITFFFGDSNFTIKTKIRLENDGEILIYSWPEFIIPASCRKKTMEYLNRRNFLSKVGALEMDIADGEIRYRTCLRHGAATTIGQILTNQLTMHQTYFARTIFPRLIKLKDPTDTTTIEALLASG
jgi:hypothetical protein